MTNREYGAGFAPPVNQGLDGHSNHRTASIRVLGGSTRVTTSSASSERALAEHAEVASRAAPSTSRVHYGPISLSGGVITEPNAISRQVASTEGHSTHSVLSTFSSTSGRPTVELEPGNPSTRTLVDVAVRMGYLARDARGNLSAAGGDSDDDFDAPEANQERPDAPKPETDPSAAAFNQEDDADWAADIEPLPQHSYDRAVASVVAVVAHDSGSLEDVARGLASSAGIEHALAAEYVREGYAMNERIVARAVADTIPAEHLPEFYAALKMKPAQLQDLMQQLVHGRHVRGWQNAAKVFSASRVTNGRPMAQAAPPAPAAPPVPAAHRPGSPGWSKNGPGKELTREQKIARALADPYGDSF